MHVKSVLHHRYGHPRVFHDVILLGQMYVLSTGHVLIVTYRAPKQTLNSYLMITHLYLGNLN
jgi:hypothetical protein